MPAQVRRRFMIVQKFHAGGSPLATLVASCIDSKRTIEVVTVTSRNPRPCPPAADRVF
jgi:hypothetical protein